MIIRSITAIGLSLLLLAAAALSIPKCGTRLGRHAAAALSLRGSARLGGSPASGQSDAAVPAHPFNR
jgi:hypothetical protein